MKLKSNKGYLRIVFIFCLQAILFCQRFAIFMDVINYDIPLLKKDYFMKIVVYSAINFS